MLDRRGLILSATAVGLAAQAAEAGTPPPGIKGGRPMPGPPDPAETIDLWPAGAPGAPAKPLAETVQERSKDPQLADRAVWGISRPRLVVFRPRSPNGSAVLVTPGGGYRWVVIDKEGYEIGRWLAARGYTVFVLFYRLPGEGWRAGPDVALADAQRSMRLIRSNAQTYGIRPERIAAMGFSAGGHVCADLSTRFAAEVYTPIDAADRLSARPNVSAPIYAVQSMSRPIAHSGSRDLLLGTAVTPELEAAHSPDHNVTARTPPTFLVHAEDDPSVPVENSLLYRAALKKAGVPVEMHLFNDGGHGFGLRGTKGKAAAIWPELFANWAATYGLG